MDENILKLTYHAGTGHMTLDLNHFLPCTKTVLRKIENLILKDNDPIARVRDVCNYINGRDVWIDETIEEGPYALGEKEIRRLRRDQTSLRVNKEDLMEWAETKRLTW